MEHHHIPTTTTFPHPLPPIPSADLSPTANLVPRPLFAARAGPQGKRRQPPPPLSIAVTVLEAPDWLPSPSSSGGSFTFTSTSTVPSSCSASPTSPGPPPYSSLSPTWTQPPPPPYKFNFQSQPSSPSSLFYRSKAGPHLLRRKPSPKQLSLRALRAKESDACLQRIYERQTASYLDGSVFGSEKSRGRRWCAEGLD